MMSRAGFRVPDCPSRTSVRIPNKSCPTPRLARQANVATGQATVTVFSRNERGATHSSPSETTCCVARSAPPACRIRLPARTRLQDIFRDADGDAFGRFPDRGAREVRVARDRVHPAVAEQPANDRQPLAKGERPRGESVSYVVRYVSAV